MRYDMFRLLRIVYRKNQWIWSCMNYLVHHFYLTNYTRSLLYTINKWLLFFFSAPTQLRLYVALKHEQMSLANLGYYELQSNPWEYRQEPEYSRSITRLFFVLLLFCLWLLCLIKCVLELWIFSHVWVMIRDMHLKIDILWNK